MNGRYNLPRFTDLGAIWRGHLISLYLIRQHPTSNYNLISKDSSQNITKPIKKNPCMAYFTIHPYLPWKNQPNPCIQAFWNYQIFFQILPVFFTGPTFFWGFLRHQVIYHGYPMKKRSHGEPQDTQPRLQRPLPPELLLLRRWPPWKRHEMWQKKYWFTVPSTWSTYKCVCIYENVYLYINNY